MEKKIKLYKRVFLVSKRYKKKEFYHFLNVPDVSLIIPIFKEKFLLVSQKREPINKINYEFPCGWVDKGESPYKSAARELLEETGYKCLDKPKKLISFFEEPGRLNSRAICFYTKKISKIGNPENGIKVIFCSKKRIIQLIKRKKFNNASHIAAFYEYLRIKVNYIHQNIKS
tara:strand:+ start:4878 stop:5393 length:516 start_codon:yes stop_codon:yes gene_type:complete